MFVNFLSKRKKEKKEGKPPLWSFKKSSIYFSLKKARKEANAAVI